ncbi:ester cyclase [Paenibacillus sp. UNC451MF]|uniref:ester cyclase n=1 Tax=Paenibacillus sp. UNC451MF TaxID=1449063 RepID=UPI00068D0242|nr:ester cyclase [Paenibacillus sp. UNC451MF]
MTDKGDQVIQKYIEAWNRHDEDELIRLFIEGGSYQDSATGVPLIGKAIGMYAKSLWMAFPDLRFEPGRLGVQPEGIAFTEWVMSGTNQGPFNGFPSTGNRFSIEGVDIFTIQEDKIASLRGYFNVYHLMQQLEML